MSATQTDPPSPAKPTAKAPSGTQYVLLSRDGVGPEDHSWRVIGDVTANSAEAAIRTADAGSGLFVAVPARSWKPVRVSVETVSRVKLEDA